MKTIIDRKQASLKATTIMTVIFIVLFLLVDITFNDFQTRYYAKLSIMTISIIIYVGNMIYSYYANRSNVASKFIPLVFMLLAYLIYCYYFSPDVIK